MEKPININNKSYSNEIRESIIENNKDSQVFEIMDGDISLFFNNMANVQTNEKSISNDEKEDKKLKKEKIKHAKKVAEEIRKSKIEYYKALLEKKYKELKKAEDEIKDLEQNPPDKAKHKYLDMYEAECRSRQDKKCKLEEKKETLLKDIDDIKKSLKDLEKPNFIQKYIKHLEDKYSFFFKPF